MPLLVPVLMVLAFAACCHSQEAKIYKVPPGGISQFPVRERGSRATEDYLELEKLVGVGQKIPSYNLLDTNKKPFNVSRLRGRIIVIDFWTTSCSPCLRAMPYLDKLAQKYGSRNVVFLSVCESQDWASFQQRVKQFRGSKLSFYLDSKSGPGGNSLRKLLHNGMGVPVQMISRNGNVIGALQGYDERADVDLKQLRHSVDVALQGEDMTTHMRQKTSSSENPKPK